MLISISHPPPNPPPQSNNTNTTPKKAYDGDTPFVERGAIRERAHILLSNPDMLHQSVCPQHRQWEGFLSALRCGFSDCLSFTCGTTILFGLVSATFFDPSCTLVCGGGCMRRF